ncbi:NirD/YgiW/YdeI family stress tolerance protein [Neisseriaceae bacterium TC5R-5]|nr:NirD/YgiW/YdeI family stress tolerance protein [Neisseriaceae bacterium TC5R-5]
MKISSLLIIAATALPISSYAAFEGPGSTSPITTVTEAKKASDDTKITLEGNIVRQVSHDTYVFSDKTGSINIEIDDEDLPAEKFNANTKVKITGEIDKNLSGNKIDVKHIEIMR